MRSDAVIEARRLASTKPLDSRAFTPFTLCWGAVLPKLQLVPGFRLYEGDIKFIIKYMCAKNYPNEYKHKAVAKVKHIVQFFCLTC